MKVWVYVSRHGRIAAFPGDSKGFETARRLQDLDNFCSMSDIIADGIEHGGSEDEGHFYIDEGGRIELVDVAEDGIMNFVYVGVDHD